MRGLRACGDLAELGREADEHGVAPQQRLRDRPPPVDPFVAAARVRAGGRRPARASSRRASAVAAAQSRSSRARSTSPARQVREPEHAGQQRPLATAVEGVVEVAVHAAVDREVALERGDRARGRAGVRGDDVEDGRRRRRGCASTAVEPSHLARWPSATAVDGDALPRTAASTARRRRLRGRVEHAERRRLAEARRDAAEGGDVPVHRVLLPPVVARPVPRRAEVVDAELDGRGATAPASRAMARARARRPPTARCRSRRAGSPTTRRRPRGRRT